MRYRREVDGMRAVAVLPVILWHAGFAVVPGGFVGVDIFFVISGFLIATILAEDIEEGRHSVLRFYERRARRILPALFVMIAVTYPLAWAWMQPDAFVGYSKSIAAATFFVSNIYFWLSTNYFSIVDAQLPLLHTWSLAVEEQFYLVFPLLLLGLWKLSPRLVVPALICGAVASLGLSEAIRDNAPEGNFYLATTRAWELLAGAAAAVGLRGRAVLAGPAAQVLSAAGLAMMLAAVFVYDSHTPFPSVYALLPVGGAVLMLVFGRAGTVAAAILSWRPLVGIGMISYSAYLWHQPIFALARIRLIEPPSAAAMAALCLLSLGIAALSWRFVERPFRVRPGALAIPAPRLWRMVGAGATALAAFASVGPLTGGARFRFAPAVNALDDQFARAFAERLVAARVGTCELNTAIVNVSWENFVKNWPCRPGTDRTRADWHIAIYGDSHSSDIAAALRLNGLNVIQVSGAGCPLSPDLMTRRCRRLAEFMKAELAASGATDLWLIERYSPRELTPAEMANLIGFWKMDGIALTAFSPIPEFPDMKDRLIKSVWLGRIGRLPRDVSAAQAFLTPENLAVFAAHSVRVVDTGAIFCAAMPGCAPYDGRTLLMTDGQHLSVEGARRFGAVLRDRLLRQENTASTQG